MRIGGRCSVLLPRPNGLLAENIKNDRKMTLDILVINIENI